MSTLWYHASIPGKTMCCIILWWRIKPSSCVYHPLCFLSNFGHRTIHKQLENFWWVVGDKVKHSGPTKRGCELDMINVLSAADNTFIMSSSMSAWLLSLLVCSPQKQNGWSWTSLRFCFWGWIMWKMYNKTIIEFGFRMISWIIKPSCLCYLLQPSASADNADLGFDNSWYHAQPHPIIVYLLPLRWAYVKVHGERCMPPKRQ